MTREEAELYYKPKPPYKREQRIEKRLEKALQESKKTAVCPSKIVEYVNYYLSALEISTTDPVEAKIEGEKLREAVESPNSFYAWLKKARGHKDERDIVFMQFANCGRLAIVANSTDIGFPKLVEPKGRYTQYDYKKLKNGCYISEIILHYLEKEWDESFVLVFPILELPEGMSSHKIERSIGNYLISKEVPILDYYSHMFGNPNKRKPKAGP